MMINEWHHRWRCRWLYDKSADDGGTIQSIKSRQLLQCHNFQLRGSSYRHNRGVIQARKIDNIRRVHHIHRDVVKRWHDGISQLVKGLNRYHDFTLYWETLMTKIIRYIKRCTFILYFIRWYSLLANTFFISKNKRFKILNNT